MPRRDSLAEDAIARRAAVVRRRAALALGGALVLALLVLGGGQGAGPAAVRVSVSIDMRHPRPAIPRRFLGLSFEVSSLAQIARYGDRGDLVTLLRSLGPGVLRFGGVSADTRTAWSDALTPRPAWASGVVGAGDLRRLGRLARASGWRVLLTVGLAHFDPRAAAREVAAAKRALGGWLEGIEVGNEPDAYAQHSLRGEPWTFSRYNAEVEAYRRAIAHATPGIPLLGPDVSGSHVFVSWGPSEATAEHPATLTGHHYPLGCRDRPAPSIQQLLSAEIRRLEGASARRYMSVSHTRAIPFRLDEANTVSCGGRAGVSDTFASALWTVDYVTRTMAAGMAGINLQGNVANCHGYAPLCAPTPERVAGGELRAQPEWYALLLGKALIGERPLRPPNIRPSRPSLDVTALLGSGGGLHVVIVNDDPLGAPSTLLRLRVGDGFAAARIMRLTARSPTASAGVQLGGQSVAGDGSWREPGRLPSSPNSGGVITLSVAPSSAVLLTVPTHR